MNPHIIESVKHHEGYRSRAYQDSVGVWTIGYGTNLQTLEIDEDLADAWLTRRLEEIEDELSDSIDFRRLDEVRQGVLIEMAYNLGMRGLFGFKKMLAAIAERDFVKAAQEGLDSKWARQVGRRAETLMERLETGDW